MKPLILNIRALGYVMIVALLAMMAVMATSYFISHENVGTIREAWKRFEVSRSEKARAFNALAREIGYGGMIHYFKNYVLRGDDALVSKAENHIVAAKSAIDNYELLDLKPNEADALSHVRNMLDMYETNLRAAGILIGKNWDIVDIDRSLRINDSLAIQALDVLDRGVGLKIQTAEYQGTKSFLLNRLRRELGYGGMIHYFKNYIIRDDHGLLEDLGRHFENIESILSKYNSHALSDTERSALSRIEAVIRDYADGLEMAIVANENGSSAKKIDNMVRVDDEPALAALNQLSRSISKEEEKLVTSVNNTIFNVGKLLETQLYFGVSVTILLIIGIVWLVWSQIVRPVTAITETVTLLAKGELQTSIPGVHQENEIGEISRALEVFRDAAAQQQKDKDSLRFAKDEAGSANMAKSEFLSSMSHELRTPLNAILGFSQLLMLPNEDPLTSAQRASVDEIERSGRLLLRLVEDVLSFAHIDYGHLSISVEDVHPFDFIKNGVSVVRGMADERGVTLTMAGGVSPDLPLIRADLTRIQQVLLNLLTNAIKYAGPRSTVRISAEDLANGSLRVSVCDDGPGIRQDQQPKVFGAFERLGMQNSHIEGTGIGLAISKSLIEAMGGQIGFESEEGVETTFWFTIPIAKEGAVPATHSDRFRPESVASPETLPLETPLTVTVLYVEDNPVSLNLMQRILRRVPTVVMISAHTGELGVELAINELPDLILMDIDLPGLDGVAAKKKLNSRPETRDIPVVAVSAAAMPKDIDRARDVGFADYITKPINIENLLMIVRQTVESKAQAPADHVG